MSGRRVDMFERRQQQKQQNPPSENKTSESSKSGANIGSRSYRTRIYKHTNSPPSQAAQQSSTVELDTEIDDCEVGKITGDSCRRLEESEKGTYSTGGVMATTTKVKSLKSLFEAATPHSNLVVISMAESAQSIPVTPQKPSLLARKEGYLTQKRTNPTPKPKESLTYEKEANIAIDSRKMSTTTEDPYSYNRQVSLKRLFHSIFLNRLSKNHWLTN